MELNDTTVNIILGVAVLAVLVANFFIKKRRMEKTALGMVVTVLDELRYNEKHVDEFSFHRSFNRFRTSHWNSNRTRLTFVPTDVMARVGKAMDMCQDVNDRLDAAKRYGSDSYMAAIDVDKMKKPITEAKESLSNWLQENVDNPELQPKKKGFLGGSLFGG